MDHILADASQRENPRFTSGGIAHSAYHCAVRKAFFAVIAFTLLSPHLVASTWPSEYPVASNDRAVLVNLFETTGGDQWLNHEKWAAQTSPCEWFGVMCIPTYRDGHAVAEIVGLLLPFNKLKGSLPAAIADLAELKTLDLRGNDLTGEFPQRILDLWDQNKFELFIEGNRFSNLAVKIRLEENSSGVRCASDEDVRYFTELQEGGVAHFESIRCGRRGSEYRLVRDGTGPSLVRLDRALKKLGFIGFASEYTYPFTFSTHQRYVTLTVWYGDGQSKSVETYGGQNPIDVWMAEELVRGLLRDIKWSRNTRQPAAQ